MFFWRKKKTRGIFKFWDGERDRAEDPILLQRTLYDHELYSDAKAKIVDKDDKFGREAYSDVLKAIRDTFSVKPLADGGLTEQESWMVFGDFIEFLEGLKKNT